MKKTLLLLSILISFTGISQSSGLRNTAASLDSINLRTTLFPQNSTITSNSQWLQAGSTTAAAPGGNLIIKNITASSITDSNKSKIVITPGTGSIAAFGDLPPAPPGLNPYFKLNITINNTFTRQLGLAFPPDATDGVDQNLDVKNTDTSHPADVFFSIENQNYVHQGIQYDEAKKIPLFAKTAVTANFTFFITELEAFDEEQQIYIYDVADKSYHNIKNEVYEVAVAPGTYTERFKICFISNEIFRIKEAEKTNIVIYQDSQNQTLDMMNPNHTTIDSFMLYDAFGRVVISKNSINTQHDFKFSTSGFTTGLYIAEFLTADNLKVTQKLIIADK